MITPGQVQTQTFTVNGQRAGWCVAIHDGQQTTRPFVATVDYTRADWKLKDTVSDTRCDIVAAALRDNAILRNAYATLAALERLRNAVRTEVMPNEAVMDAEDAATQLIKAIKEG